MKKETMKFFVQASSEEPGITFDEFTQALQVWSFMRPSDNLTTVREAADAFGVTDDVIRAAVKAHYWMFLSGPDDDPTKQKIEHEGE